MWLKSSNARNLQFAVQIRIQVGHRDAEHVVAFNDRRQHGQFGAANVGLVVFVALEQRYLVTFHRIVVVVAAVSRNLAFDDVQELEHVN